MSSVTLDIPSAAVPAGTGGCSEGWMISVGCERQDLSAGQAEPAKPHSLWVCLSEKWPEKAAHDG